MWILWATKKKISLLADMIVEMNSGLEEEGRGKKFLCVCV